MFESLTEPVTSALSNPAFGLAGVALAAFVAATLLPLASEVVLLAWVMAFPESAWLGVAVASVANTAGGMASYASAAAAVHVLGTRADGLRRWHAKYQRWTARYGAPLMLLAWLPFLGDALVLAAGAVRLNALACCAYQAVGRTLRYVFIVGLYSAL